MKLASLKGGRDGSLTVVDRALRRAVLVPDIAPTLQDALDDWPVRAPMLRQVAERLEFGDVGDAFDFDVFDFDAGACAAPLPRAYLWADGSAYLNHMELVRKARGADLPSDLLTDPLLYQGGSDGFLGPCDDIVVAEEEWGLDFEAEVAVITGDVVPGTSREAAAQQIALVVLVNDISLRHLIPGEIAKNFGFFQSKPASSFSPVAVTPDELGEAWDGAKVSLPLSVDFNGQRFGDPNAGVDLAFDFPTLIAHAARTRALTAGSIIGSGTVSNRDRARGSCCLAEQRAIEMLAGEVLAGGEPVTPFMRHGDRVRIEMFDDSGKTVFGAIDQLVATRGGQNESS